MADKSFSASHRYARISASKARVVADLVRGRGVEEALTLLEYEPRRAAGLLRAVIRSALATASQDLDVKIKELVVADCRVDGGPLLQGRVRFMPRAQGRAFPIRKRTSHFWVTLREGAPKPVPARRGKRKAPAPSTAPATP